MYYGSYSKVDEIDNILLSFNNKYIRQQLAKEKIPHFLLKKPKKQLLIIQ